MTTSLTTKLIAVLGVDVLVIAALLMATAGDWLWPSVWAFVGLFGVMMFGASLALVRRDPGLIEERLSFPMKKDEPAADKLWRGLFALGFLGILLVAGLDERFEWSGAPVLLQLLGGLGLALTFWVLFVAMRYNSYLAPVVKVQSDRGQTVVTTGPYAIVRHPFYAGLAPFGVFAALLLDSWWAVIPALLAGVALGLRISQEERFLRASLAGYEAYVLKTRFRLLPLVW